MIEAGLTTCGHVKPGWFSIVICEVGAMSPKSMVFASISTRTLKQFVGMQLVGAAGTFLSHVSGKIVLIGFLRCGL